MRFEHTHIVVFRGIKSYYRIAGALFYCSVINQQQQKKNSLDKLFLYIALKRKKKERKLFRCAIKCKDHG